MRDKEAYSMLTQLYYDTATEERPAFLKKVVEEANKTRKRLKDLELQKLEDEEQALAQIADHYEEITEREAEDVRRQSAGGDDEEAGEGGDAGGPGGPALPGDAPRLQLP
jgi:predicted  nucleic acid-binding Zn-ribbon protein